MAFPSSPSNGQTYSQGGTQYVYNSTYGVWDVNVTTINADTLDGIDSTGFITSANGKAPDSNLLDGLDSTQFLRSDTSDTTVGDITLSTPGSSVGFNSNYNYKPYVTGGAFGARSELISNANMYLHSDMDGSGPSEWLMLRAGAGTPNELKLISKTSGQGQDNNALLLNGNVVINSANVSSYITVTPSAVSDQSNTSTGYFDLPVGTTGQRPASANSGMLRYNSDKNAIEFYSSSPTNPSWVVIGILDGTSSSNAAPSGYYIAQNFPTYSSGMYWIKPTGATAAIEMYVDMSADGGGYDFYQCTGCTATTYATQASGCPTGTNYVYGRSSGHWTILLSRYGNGYMNNCGTVYKTSGGGNYTGCFMRNPSYYGSGCADWRVPDGGKWWLKDSTHSEPNGDYTANGWLQLYPSATVSNMGFNDGGAYSSGTNYVCSTNAKP